MSWPRAIGLRLPAINAPETAKKLLANYAQKPRFERERGYRKACTQVNFVEFHRQMLASIGGFTWQRHTKVTLTALSAKRSVILKEL